MFFLKTELMHRRGGGHSDRVRGRGRRGAGGGEEGREEGEEGAGGGRGEEKREREESFARAERAPLQKGGGVGGGR